MKQCSVRGVGWIKVGRFASVPRWLTYMYNICMGMTPSEQYKYSMSVAYPVGVSVGASSAGAE